MTGIEEAARWLEEHAEGWMIRWSSSDLQAGDAAGAPTRAIVYVELVAQTFADRYPGPVLLGTGATHLEAVQAAIGGLR
jgi:hypothetical protein